MVDAQVVELLIAQAAEQSEKLVRSDFVGRSAAKGVPRGQNDGDDTVAPGKKAATLDARVAAGFGTQLLRQT